MRQFIFFFIAAAAVMTCAHAEETNVVPLRTPVSALRCVDLFQIAGAPRPAASVLNFSDKMPPLEEIQTFLRDMPNSGAEYFYYSAGLHAPLSKRDYGAWAADPYLNVGRDIFILKTEPRPALFGEKIQHRVVRVEDLRRTHRLISYARLEVPPIFFLLYKTIYFTRAIQSHLSGLQYASVPLNHMVVIQDGPLYPRLVKFVESWHPRDVEEQMVKDMLTTLLETHYGKNSTAESLHLFSLDLSRELVFLYPPEFTISITDHL